MHRSRSVGWPGSDAQLNSVHVLRISTRMVPRRLEHGSRSVERGEESAAGQGLNIGGPE